MLAKYHGRLEKLVSGLCMSSVTSVCLQSCGEPTQILCYKLIFFHNDWECKERIDIAIVSCYLAVMLIETSALQCLFYFCMVLSFPTFCRAIAFRRSNKHKQKCGMLGIVAQHSQSHTFLVSGGDMALIHLSTSKK